MESGSLKIRLGMSAAWLAMAALLLLAARVTTPAPVASMTPERVEAAAPAVRLVDDAARRPVDDAG